MLPWGFGVIMKKLTKEEFEDRVMAVFRARQIFIDSGITKNVSLAFELYQKVCADRDREIFLSTQVLGNREPKPFDKFVRPKCECGADMYFRRVQENDEGIKVQLVCANPKCDIVLNSENDIDWWMKNLEVKDEPV